jgi:DNA-binding CsgD family transcriptional regulator
MAGTPIALSEHDLQTMVSIVATAETVASDPPIGLPWSVLHRIRDLIRCDELECHDLESRRERVTFSVVTRDSGDVFTSKGGQALGGNELFWQQYWQGPCSYPERSGDLRGVTMESDFFSDRQWRSSRFFLDQDQDPPLLHSMLLTLPGGPGRTVRLVADRQDGPGFSERERSILLLLRPHLESIHQQVERRRQALPDLTVRQWELLRLVALGHTNTQIARALGVAEGTVRKHMENIHQRLGVNSRTAAVASAFAARQGGSLLQTS